MVNKNLLNTLKYLVDMSTSVQNRVCLHYEKAPWYIEEFCTIKIKGPRGCGHTDAIKKFIKKNKKFNPIIWVPFNRMANNFKEFKNISIISRYSELKGLNNRMIICDCASYLSLEDKHKLQDHLLSIRTHDPIYLILME